MEKIVLYYKFVPVSDSESVYLWQKALCEKLGLKGRVLISNIGINGTLGGDFKALKMYKRTMNEHSLFKDTVYKWSDGSGDDFPRLSIKVRTEIVTLGWKPRVSEKGIVDGGRKLKPAALHKFLEKNPDTVFFDGRNNYESAIGKFKNALTPNINNFRDFPEELDKAKYSKLKEKPVVTYCTGGIRCESLTALMKRKGFKRVYQIDGGIVKYGEKFGDEGFWQGKCFVFDKRLALGFSDKAKDIGICVHCDTKTSNYINCANKACNKLVLVCDKCAIDKSEQYCHEHSRINTIPSRNTRVAEVS